MKTCFCTNVFPNEQIPAACAALSALGWDGIELWDGYLKTADIYRLRDMLEAMRLRVFQLCPYFNVTGDREQLEETYRIAQAYIEKAHALHCGQIRVFTGSVGSADADARQYAQGVEGLRHICRMDESVYFVLETHMGSLADTTASTLQLLEDVGCSNLKVNLQVPLNNGQDAIMDSVHTLGRYVAHIHAHNWIGNRKNLTYLDNGDYAFDEFLAALHGEGFNGAVSIEHGNHLGKREPLEVARHEIAYLKKLIERIEQP